MNSNMSDTVGSTVDHVDEESTSIEDDMRDIDLNQQSQSSVARSSAGSTSSNGTTAAVGGARRQKEMPPCYVCGARANGYNFDQITCESCKAFFRRNALKSTEKFRCRSNDNCVITVATRKRCKRCRLNKCFRVGMRKEWILTEEEKSLKRRKIERNRMIKQQAQMVFHQQANNVIHSSPETANPHSSTIRSPSQQSLIISIPSMHMYHPGDQQMFERQQYFLRKLTTGYQSLTIRYPQPNKFGHRNLIISQTVDIDEKLSLIKDLTRELTQMTTLRLLYFFDLIPEFQSFTQQEKTAILTQNMLAVFMFHGALTYDPEHDICVDRTTNDEPYDAKYMLIVYGQRIYKSFVALARQLTSVTYQSPNDKESVEHSHKLFLLLMAILLFSSDFPNHSIEHNQTNLFKLKEKLNKIQQTYVELVYRFVHDKFGVTVGKQMFQKLVPLLRDLQNLCSILANVNLCEMAEDDDRSSTTTSHSNQQSTRTSSTTEFNSTMISERSHLNELQKENRAPAEPPVSSSIVPRMSPSILTNSSSTTPVPTSAISTHQYNQV